MIITNNKGNTIDPITHQSQVINDVPDAFVLCRAVATIGHGQGKAYVPWTHLTPQTLGQLSTDVKAPVTVRCGSKIEIVLATALTNQQTATIRVLIKWLLLAVK
jgi:hypothetical protein